MKLIPLTRGLFAKVDDEDFEALSRKSWNVVFKNNGTYPCVRGAAGKRNRKITMASYIMRPPLGLEVDHKNGDPLDNQKANLRVCSHGDNMCNRPKPDRANNHSKLKGVCFAGHCNKRNPWSARVTRNRITINLGYYPTEQEAAHAYDAWALLMHGEFSHTNEQHAA